MKTLIQLKEGDVRLYDLCESCQGKVMMLGRAKAYRQAAYKVV